jgi:Tol biopolymer transport system component
MRRIGFVLRRMLTAGLALALSVCASPGGAFAAPGDTTLVSRSSAGAPGNWHHLDPSISADGRYVAFASNSDNLVTGDTNLNYDIFVRDRVTGATTRVSVSSSGAQASTFDSDGSSSNPPLGSRGPSISGDGRYVAFWSDASDLVADDTNKALDVFVHDRVTGATTRVSVSRSGVQAGGSYPDISSDGRYVAFVSSSNVENPGDTSGYTGGVYVKDRVTGAVTRVSVNSSGAYGLGECFNPSISSDGRYVAFESNAENLVAGHTGFAYDVFVRDRVAGTTSCASVSSSGAQGDKGPAWGQYPDSRDPSISSDGRFVAFRSYASNLVTGDTNELQDIFLHDRATGATSRVSVSSSGVQADSDGWAPSISADGRYVAFDSWASNLVPGDTNRYSDIFVHDRVSGVTTRASVNSSGEQGDDGSSNPSISADGRYVAFSSSAHNLLAGNIFWVGGIYVRETGGAAGGNTSISIKTNATSTKIGKTPILSGSITPNDIIGKIIVVYVKKPGKSYWPYSSNRVAYSLYGNAAWQYKYFFKRGMAKGVYTYKAAIPAYPGYAPAVSPTTVSIRVK